MQVLKKIQEAAVDGNSSITDLLRLVRVLASQLKDDALKEWVQAELEGYSDRPDEDIPRYRRLSMMTKGHFQGWGGSGLRNADIPSAALGEENCDLLTKHCARQPIVAYQELLRNAEGEVHVPHGAEVAATIGQKVYQHMNCVQAWGVIGRGQIDAIIDGVRNRVLEISIELMERFPEMETGFIKDENRVKARDAVKMIIKGGNQNIAISGTDFSQSITLTQGDSDGLRRALIEHGVTEEDACEIVRIASEELPDHTRRFGPRMQAAILALMNKALDGSWGVGIEAGGALLADLIKRYYGWK